MENCPPFELAELQRDWVVGLSGESLHEKVRLQIDRLSQIEALPRRGLLLSESDPFVFTVVFFAAAYLRIPVILANPHWGATEWGELSKLVTPALSIGVSRDVSNSVDPCELEPGAVLIPTGGTSGGVKLAVHDWESLAAACRGVQDFLGVGAIDSCCCLPLFHVSGLMQLLRSFITGGRIRFDDTNVSGCCLSLVPTQLQRLMRDEKSIQKLNTAKVIFVGGAALPKLVAQQAREARLPVVPVYGMTETAAMVAAISNAAFLSAASPGAVAVGSAQFQIEQDGRLRIFSPALFQGYQGQPRIERSVGYLTDDEARIDAAGHLHVLGRMDRLINSGGEKIDPAEVEVALLDIEGVQQALVLGQPDAEWGERVVAYLVFDGREIEPDTLKALLASRLARHKIPKEWLPVAALPLNSHGKLIRDR